MDFRLTEEQELLLESVDEFIKQCPEMGFDTAYFRNCYDANQPPHEYNKALVESGLGTLGLPERFGGTEVDLLTMVLVAERFQSNDFPHMLGAALQVDDMITFGNEEQLKIVSECFMNGRRAFSLGISEPQAGSDNNMLQTLAEHRDGKVILNGHKSFISNASSAPYMLCVAREAEPVDEKHWASMYFVPMNTPGIKMAGMHKLGCKYDTMEEVYLENVELPESALVGERGNGFLQLMKNFELERLVIAANCLGMAQCAFNDAAAYANQRIAFGQPIGRFQLIQEMITECQMKLVNMRNFCYMSAWQRDNGISVRTNSGLCKYYCARAGFEVVDSAMQILGGLGYCEDHRVSRIWKDIRLNRIGGGTDQIMIHTTSREILKQYL